MTTLVTQRGRDPRSLSLFAHMHQGSHMKTHQEEGPHQETDQAVTLISDLQLPEPGEIKCLLFKPCSLWYSGDRQCPKLTQIHNVVIQDVNTRGTWVKGTWEFSLQYHVKRPRVSSSLCN